MNEEIDVLKSIYSEDCIEYRDDGNGGGKVTYNHDKYPKFRISFEITNNYPGEQPRMSVEYINRPALASTVVLVNDRLQQTLISNQGEVILHALIEAVRDVIGEDTTNANSTVSHSERTPSDEALTINQTPHDLTYVDNLQIYHGEISIEQKSTFQAHAAQVSSMEEVKQFHDLILKDKKVPIYGPHFLHYFLDGLPLFSRSQRPHTTYSPFDSRVHVAACFITTVTMTESLLQELDSRSCSVSWALTGWR